MKDGPSYEQIAELFGLQVEAERPDVDSLDEKEEPATPLERGRQKMSAGDFLAAVKHFKQAVEESGDADREAVMALAISLEATDASAQAIQQYIRALELQLEDPEPRVGLSSLLKREGRGKEALVEAQAAIEADPTNAFLHYRLAELLRSLGYPSKAYAVLQSAILLEPDRAFYHSWAADLLIQLKRWDEAILSIQAAVELSPGDEDLYVQTAIAFWGAGRGEDAIKAAGLASELAPKKDYIFGLLQAFYRGMGNLEEAARLDKKVAKLDAFDRDVLRRRLSEAGL